MAPIGRGAHEEYRVEASDFRELDGERILVLIHLGWRGKTSGPEFGQLRTSAASLFPAREDNLTKLVSSMDRERAFGDHGLAYPRADS
jgi:hypothetical protein